MAEHTEDKGTTNTPAEDPKKAAQPAAAQTPAKAGGTDASATSGTPDKPGLGLRIMAILCFLGSLALIPRVVSMLMSVEKVFEMSGTYSLVSRIIYIIMAVCAVAAIITFIVLGVELFRQNRHRARHVAQALIVMVLVELLGTLMLFGITIDLIGLVLAEVVLVIVVTYIDPELAQERKLQHTLRDMELRDEAEHGTLGLDKSGKGFIQLDFFNLFWIFVICAFLGDMIESVYHVIVVDPGHWQDRAGVLYGQFSPIYGFGAVLMTIALNRFHKAPIIVIFLVSAVIGGAFEYFVSWFMQFAFGAVAWDYSGTFGNIDGRTNVFFMCMWGLLGVAWIKLMLPFMLKVVNLIPWKWRYSVTTVCAALMILDGAMTLLALDFWYERLAGHNPQSAMAQFFAHYYDNEWMADRFQSMTIDPGTSTRTS